MDKTTASAKIASEVSPLDEFFVTLSAKFVNKICLNKKKKCYRDTDCMKSGDNYYFLGPRGLSLIEKSPLFVVLA